MLGDELKTTTIPIPIPSLSDDSLCEGKNCSPRLMSANRFWVQPERSADALGQPEAARSDGSSQFNTADLRFFVVDLRQQAYISTAPHFYFLNRKHIFKG